MRVGVALLFLLTTLSVSHAYLSRPFMAHHKTSSVQDTKKNPLATSVPPALTGRTASLLLHAEDKNGTEEVTEPSAFDKVASTGLAGILAIATAESIFWALGVPLAQLWSKYSTGEFIDMSTSDGQLQAAGFSFGYGGFATAILQYRVTLFAIPLVPLMDKFIVKPGKRLFGESFGAPKNSDEDEN